MTAPSGPHLASAITSAITGIWAEAYGKGPDVARTYINDENVVVVMHGGLLPAEQRLVDAGERETVRRFRQRFEQVLAADLTAAVEAITGRTVLTYESQIAFQPTRTFELFVLDR